MSRIGRLPIDIPNGVTVNVTNENNVVVKGPKGELTTKVDKNITVKVEENQVVVSRNSNDKKYRAMHGLYRSLINNTMKGVTEGYVKELIVNGVGYKVAKQGKKIILNVGFSHPVEYVEPEGITIDIVGQNEIAVKGIDNIAVGQCAAEIKSIKKPDPYHIYGIRYKNEVIMKKEGKTGK